MGGASSSSSSASFSLKKYDVFISFRGEDTRTNFTSHLHAALCHKSIRTYIDYELSKGDHISQSLIQAIQDSSISLVIFSQNYTSSKWCLDELTQILQCKQNHQQIVIPVFYKVDPTDVRNQNGTCKEAFAKHERDFVYCLHKVQSWKYALFEIANLVGWDSRNFTDEYELIQNIVNDILRKLDHRYPSALKGLVGIEENCNHIELLLENVPIIGIWGMGGIGKTTMAKAVFSELFSQFDSYCFVENVREESEKHGLSYIRDKLILELLKEENLHGSTPKVLGSTFVMRRLSSKKVFVVLDDVNKSEQLEYLARECDCLGPGSRVIITTRDKHLLIGRVNKIHEAMALNYHESMKLFCLKAFNQNHPKMGYEELSKRAVVYANGIPLALKVLGSDFHSRSIETWESTLKKLEKYPNVQIQNVLKVSYDGLDCVEKDIFLDVAFFFKGEFKDDVIRALDGFGFYGANGIDSLLDKALITLSSDNKIQMHDLIQEMGWKIVREESIKDPGKRSRLIDTEEVYDVLKNNKGTEAIEGIVLDISLIKDVYLNADTFKKMTNLRFLKFYSYDWNQTSYNVNLPLGLESFCERLRYFHWDGYPLKSLPSSFPVEKLVKLRMRNSQVTKLWDGVQDFVNLSEIDLSGSKQLMELPDFSKARNLQLVGLCNCKSLCNVHPSILSLNSLVTLNLNECTELKSLKSETHLKSLKHLYVYGCSNLKEFSLSSEEITELLLEETSIEILHSSIGRLSKLSELRINGETLKNLPMNEICWLRSLKQLGLRNYRQVIEKWKLHILFDALPSLECLNLYGCCNLIELPNNIKYLSRLEYFVLNNCKRLRSLPELPPSIICLEASCCTSLENLPPIGHVSKLRWLRLDCSSLENLLINEFCCLRSLGELHLENCGKLIDKSKLHILFDALRSLEKLYLEGCSNLYELPDNISALSSLKILCLNGSNVESLPASIKYLSILYYIDLNNCRSLRSLPELPPSIIYLKACNCKQLEYFSLKQQVCKNYARYEVCYPGRRVPEWFRYKGTTKASITIELAPPFHDLLGFIFSAVCPQFTFNDKCPSYLECECYLKDEYVGCWNSQGHIPELDSDHILLYYEQSFFQDVLERVKRRGNNEGTTYITKFSFEFFVCTHEYGKNVKHDGLIKACGVCPIYADSELELELGTKTKRRRDIDEQQQLPPTKKMN